MVTTETSLHTKDMYMLHKCLKNGSVFDLILWLKELARKQQWKDSDMKGVLKALVKSLLLSLRMHASGYNVSRRYWTMCEGLGCHGTSLGPEVEYPIKPERGSIVKQSKPCTQDLLERAVTVSVTMVFLV